MNSEGIGHKWFIDRRLDMKGTEVMAIVSKTGKTAVATMQYVCRMIPKCFSAIGKAVCVLLPILSAIGRFSFYVCAHSNMLAGVVSGLLLGIILGIFLPFGIIPAYILGAIFGIAGFVTDVISRNDR